MTVRTTALLALALAGAPAAAAAPPEEIRESDLYFADPANLAQLLEQARDSLAAGRAEAARAGVDAVVASVRKAGDVPELRPLLVRALILRARVHLEAQERRAAIADLEEALAADPSAPPEVKPKTAFAALFAETRRRLVGKLSVDTDPSGATVSIEGRVLGTTPLAGVAVLSGTRFLRLERAGYAAVEREVVIPATGSPVRVRVPLERRGSTFLLLTDAAGAAVRMDGVDLGRTRRPEREEAERLVAAFNLPIDPLEPPALFLWEDASPGTHALELSAPCRRSAARAVEVADGADSTTTLPLERATGSLAVAGAADVRVRVDGAEPLPPPFVAGELCPGAHVVEFLTLAPPARKGRATVFVREGEETRFLAEPKPILAVLRADPETRARLLALARFHVFLAGDGPAGDPARVVDAGGSVNEPGRDLVVAATDADLLAWSDGAPPARTLVLLAAAAGTTERLPADGDRALAAATAALDAPTALTTADLGLAAVETRFAAHPLVAALAEDGPAHRGSLFLGDELVAVAGDEVSDLAGLDAAVARAAAGESVRLGVRRAGADVAIEVVPRRAAVDPDFTRTALPASAALARLTWQLLQGGASDAEAARIQFARGKAYLALADWERAFTSLRSAELEVADGVGQGTADYYRALAALRAGRADEARAALRRAVTHPGARLLGPDGPPVLPLASALLATLPAAEPDGAAPAAVVP